MLVEIGETGDVAWAEDEDGALLVYFSQTVRDAGETLHVAWPCSAAVADADGLHWAKPQTGMLEFDVPRVQSQSFAMADERRLGGVADGDGHSGEHNAARHGAGNPTIGRARGWARPCRNLSWRMTNASSIGMGSFRARRCADGLYRLHADRFAEQPAARADLGRARADESIRFDFDTQTAAMTKGAER